eukprot:SM000024S07840  [mRNA]  locus=s24:884643:888146:- [translate_table: standard]
MTVSNPDAGGRGGAGDHVHVSRKPVPWRLWLPRGRLKALAVALLLFVGIALAVVQTVSPRLGDLWTIDMASVLVANHSAGVRGSAHAQLASVDLSQLEAELGAADPKQLSGIEDFGLASAMRSLDPEVQLPVTESLPSECGDRKGEAVDCGHPTILEAVEDHLQKEFPQTVFSKFRKALKVDNPTQCDVSWHSRRDNNVFSPVHVDYRRISFSWDQQFCRYDVDAVAGFFSGAVARETYDPMPFDGSVKYLFYRRSSAFCAGVVHKYDSLNCYAAEARYLNRTLVLDRDYCMDPGHADTSGDWQYRDIHMYYDVEYLKTFVNVVYMLDFEHSLDAWNKGHPDNPARVTILDKLQASQPLKEDSSTIIRRDFPGKYWYMVCMTPDNQKTINRTYGPLRPAPFILEMAEAIGSAMGPDFDTVHVRRGDKATQRKADWPHVDEDTQPEALIKKLPALGVPFGRILYIATNERDPKFFDLLKQHYTIHLLKDFEHLWAFGSKWQRETVAKYGSRGVLRFDGYLAAMLDYEVMKKGRQRIETFNDLTQDCRHGVKYCSHRTH